MTSDIKISEIICAKCNSKKIDLHEMCCKSCGNIFTDEDVSILLEEAYEEHISEKTKHS